MYQRLFDGDNPLWRSMGLVFDLFVLNVLWLLCSLPLITLLPATAALLRCVQLLRSGEEGYVHRDFLHALRELLRTHWGSLLVQTLVGGMLSFNVALSHRSGRGVFTFVTVFFFVLLLLWLFQLHWFLGALGTAACTAQELFLLSLYRALRFLPRTLLMGLLLILAFWLIHLLNGLVFLNLGLLAWADTGLMASALSDGGKES